LAFDLGSFGSEGYYNSLKDKRLIPLRDQIISDVFNGSIHVGEREKMLTNVGGITDRGFIAMLEKTIATHADCIVLLGTRSSFVQSAAYSYISRHASTKKCIISICGEDYHDASNRLISTHSIADDYLHA